MFQIHTKKIISLSLQACAPLLLTLPAHGEANNNTSTILAEPLEKPAKAANSATKFTALTPEATGIDFEQTFGKLKEHAYFLEASSVFAGGSSCTGDFDLDGKLDLFLVSPLNGCRLYRNVGGLKFEDVTEKTGINNDEHILSGPSVADIDNDGDLDIYLCRYNAPNSLYINQGDGSFVDKAKEYGLDFTGSSVLMSFADYDRDGDLDGYLVTYRILDSVMVEEPMVKFENGKFYMHPDQAESTFVLTKPDQSPHFVSGAQFDHFYRNNGDGTFSNVTNEVGLGGNNCHGHSALWLDYNNDNYPDLYVANDFFGPDHLFRNNQDGTFTDVVAELIPNTPWYSMGVDFADINNDGYFDMLASDMLGTTHYRQKVMMGDMSGGWFLEMGPPFQYMRNAMYLNTGKEQFFETAFLSNVAKTDWTWGVKFADLDNDGWQDIFITNGTPRDWMNSDYIRQFDAIYEETGSAKQAFDTVWKDNDFQYEKNIALHNQQNLMFETVGENWGLDKKDVSYGNVAADFDSDGDLDLVVCSFDEIPTVYRNNTIGQNAISIRLQGKDKNHFGMGARLVAHTEMGLQTRYVNPNRGLFSWEPHEQHFGLGSHTGIDKLMIHWPSGSIQEVNNLKANHRYTITEQNNAQDYKPDNKTHFTPSNAFSNVVHQETPFDDFYVQPLLPNKLSQLGPGIAWADIDGDGDSDAYFGGGSGSPGQIMICEGPNQYTADTQRVFHEHKNHEDMAALFIDIDSDGDEDLFVASGSYEHAANSFDLCNRLYLNNGKGRFSHAPVDTFPEQKIANSVVAAADFEGDGDLDIFVGGRLVPGEYPVTPSSTLLINEGGKFTDQTKELAPSLLNSGLVTSALWTDVDQDGSIDLMVTHEWGPVKYYRNNNGKLVDQTEESGLAKYTGWWNGIAGGDIDNDGDIDYVATNFGQNTKYRTSHKKPASIYYGDYNNDGIKRIVEAKKSGKTTYPIRGKSCSTNAMPHLAKKFKSFHQFASASLQDIYTNECLDEALHLKATTLDTSLLVNEGGKFKLKPLPLMAQISPSFGVVLHDFNLDGNLDIFLAQNFFSPQRETGRMHGGLSLLLQGNGQGDFSTIWPKESGIKITGDAKAATLVDINQDQVKDICTTLNNGELVGHINQASSDLLTTVKFEGKPGNKAGVGNRIEVILEDDSAISYELYSGGGYLSQSSVSDGLNFVLPKKAKAIKTYWPNKEVSLTKVDPGQREIIVRQNTEFSYNPESMH